MTDLSPAQKALDAFNERYELCGPFDDDWVEQCLAAALRAAVRYCQSEYWSEGEQRLAKRMLMISDELEAQ